MSNKVLYCWVCDYSKITGEGNLARQYVKYLNKKFETKIIQINQINWIQSNYVLRLIFGHKYISPFVGVLFIWYYFFKKKNCCYINYLPLWNFLLFLLLPPGIMLGPITGGALFNKNSKNYIIRKYFFNFFYFLSNSFLVFKSYKEIHFATNLLQDKIFKSLMHKSKFNFIYKMFKLKPKVKTSKKIDLLIYYKKHQNKIETFPVKLIKKLLALKISIAVIGDKLDIFGIKNYGYVDGEKKKFIFKTSKIILSSSENIYTIFAMEAINYNLKILIDKKNSIYIDKFKSNFIVLDFNKYQIIKYFLKHKKIKN